MAFSRKKHKSQKKEVRYPPLPPRPARVNEAGLPSPYNDRFAGYAFGFVCEEFFEREHEPRWGRFLESGATILPPIDHDFDCKFYQRCSMQWGTYTFDKGVS